MNSLSVGTDTVTVRVNSHESAGDLLAMEVHIPAGGGPPVLHRHAPQEIYRIEDGELALYVEDGDGAVRRHAAHAGDVVHIPANREHTIRNESDAPAHAYVVFSPGEEIEGFMRAAAALKAPEVEQVLATAERHGIEMTRPVPEGD